VLGFGGRVLSPDFDATGIEGKFFGIAGFENLFVVLFGDMDNVSQKLLGTSVKYMQDHGCPYK